MRWLWLFLLLLYLLLTPYISTDYASRVWVRKGELTMKKRVQEALTDLCTVDRL